MKKEISLGLKVLCLMAISMVVWGCKSGQKQTEEAEKESLGVAVGPKFNPDSAYAFIAAQCEFGARVMNSDAHERCGAWIVRKFTEYGCKVETQKTDLKGYDGTTLKATNIIAKFKPEASRRILLCAHWDSRPWADNDPDSINHQKPVMAANDGASGVAVILEIARLLQSDSSLNVGVDFVCFDAEDWGVPQWDHGHESTDGSWVLGSTYFANHLPEGFNPEFGILLDMVGGEGAQFYKEGISLRYASDVLERVWQASKVVGYGSYFLDKEGGWVTDDHYPLNEIAKIPTIDIIPYNPDYPRSSFGPTWHTIHDTLDHIDKNTLMAVGQTVIQVLYSH